MKNKVFYIILILLTFAAYIFFQAEMLGFLVVYETILLFFLFILSHILVRKVKAAITVPYYHAQKGSAFPLEVCLTNRSRLPVPLARVELICTNEFTGREFTIGDMAMLAAKSASTLHFYLEAGCCGKVSIRIGGIYIYDYFRIFCRKAPISTSLDEVMVLPGFCVIRFGSILFEKDKYAQGMFSHLSSGEDTSEVHDIHEFRPGDTMQRVHWKLTAKTGNYLVKEYSMPLERMVYLFVDLCMDVAAPPNSVQYDCFLEILASVSWSLMKQNLKHIVVWYDSDLKAPDFSQIEVEQDIYTMLDTVCSLKMYDEPVPIRSLYWQQREQKEPEGSLMLDLYGHFFRNGICIKKFGTEDIEKELSDWKPEI